MEKSYLKTILIPFSATQIEVMIKRALPHPSSYPQNALIGLEKHVSVRQVIFLEVLLTVSLKNTKDSVYYVIIFFTLYAILSKINCFNFFSIFIKVLWYRKNLQCKRLINLK